MAEISHDLLMDLAGRFNFPTDFTVVDTETSGLSADRHLVCSIGLSTVRDGMVVENFEKYLNWTVHPSVDQTVLRQDLLDLAAHMEGKGNHLYHTYEALQKYGEPPLDVLNEFLVRFEALEDRKEVLVAHNGSFDMAFLHTMFEKFLGVNYEFDMPFLDSGSIVKAAQLPDSKHPRPKPGESVRDWSYRIRAIHARGVFWSLSHCDHLFSLGEKIGVKQQDLHRAATDSYMVAALIRELRKIAGLVG